MAITKIESLRDFFRIWFFWKRQAIVTFLFIIGVVMFYAYTATPKYESLASVLLLPKTNQDLIITAEPDERQVIQKITSGDLNTEMDLLLSDKVIADTIKMFPEDSMLGLKSSERGLFDMVQDTIRGGIHYILRILQLKDSLSPLEAKTAMLKQSLSVLSFDSNILEVSLKAEKPKQAALVLGKLLENYVRHHNQVFSIDEGLDFYTDQTEVYHSKLDEAERALRDFQQSNNIVNLEVQNGANIALFTALKKEQQYLEIAYDEGKARNEIFSKSLLAGDDVLVTKEMRTLPAIVELEKGIIPLLIKRSEISKTFTEESREYKDISGQIAMLNGEIKNTIRKALAADKIELESLYAKKESLLTRVEDIHGQAVLLKDKERALQALQRQVDFLKSKYLLYASKTETSRIYSDKKERKLGNVIISDGPSTPVRPVSPRKLLLLVLSTLFSTIAAVVMPFILESFDQKLKTSDDVEHILDIPVVSSFSDVSMK